MFILYFTFFQHVQHAFLLLLLTARPCISLDTLELLSHSITMITVHNFMLQWYVLSRGAIGKRTLGIRDYQSHQYTNYISNISTIRSGRKVSQLLIVIDLSHRCTRKPNRLSLSFKNSWRVRTAGEPSCDPFSPLRAGHRDDFPFSDRLRGQTKSCDAPAYNLGALLGIYNSRRLNPRPPKLGFRSHSVAAVHSPSPIALDIALHLPQPIFF